MDRELRCPKSIVNVNSPHHHLITIPKSNNDAVFCLKPTDEDKENVDTQKTYRQCLRLSLTET